MAITKKYAIIVAGGSGLRMQTAISKQFLLLKGLPVLMHTIKAFVIKNLSIDIILVLPDSQIKYWQNLCKVYQFNYPTTIAKGGATRFHSVQNALQHIPTKSNAIVAVHDAVRPFIDATTITKLFQEAERYGNAVPCIPLNDSLRKINGNTNIALNRNDYCSVQTPQCFEITSIKKAYEQNFSTAFTDDASVVETTGELIHLTEGNLKNIKITTPQDLIIAAALLSQEII